MARLEQEQLLERSGHDLKSHGKTGPGRTAGKRERRESQRVERTAQPQKTGAKVLPIGELVLIQLRSRRRGGRTNEQVDLLESTSAPPNDLPARSL
jgi:hypothetical protein